ncbi:hypothetical protein [Rossellomorea sp. FM04394]|uniref:hypothetical protein n=1 Tax=Rossellomorea sp. FM04394 TaxID=3243076 RepID=UPI0035A69B8E
MSYPWASAAIIRILLFFTFLFSLIFTFSGEGVTSFFIMIGSGYFVFVRDIIRLNKEKTKIEDYTGEKPLLVKRVYTSISGGKAYIGLTDHYLVKSQKGNISKLNLHTILDTKVGQSGTGNFNTTVREWGKHVTATTREEKVPYIAFLFEDNGIEDSVIYYSEISNISKIAKTLSKLTTTGIIAKEREESQRGKERQRELNDAFKTHVEMVISSMKLEEMSETSSITESFTSIKKTTIQKYMSQHPQLNALNEQELNDLGMVLQDSFTRGVYIAQKTLGDNSFKDASLLNVNAIEPLVYSVLGLHRGAFEENSFVTNDHLVSFITEGLEQGFQSGMKEYKIAT